MAVNPAGSASPSHQPSAADEPVSTSVQAYSPPAPPDVVAGPLAGLARRNPPNRLNTLAPEILANIAKHALPADLIALARADLNIYRMAISDDVHAAAMTIFHAPHITTLAAFNVLRAEIEALPIPSLRERPLTALGAHIPQLPADDQHEAVDGFLMDAQKDVGPRSNFLEVLVHGATKGPGHLGLCLQSWRTDPEKAVALGPAHDAVLAAMHREHGTGETWSTVAARWGIIRIDLLNQLHMHVAYGPGCIAAVAAMRPDGDGEFWHQVAVRMGITNPGMLQVLERSVAEGPARDAALAAMEPEDGSGELWNMVADRMEISDPVMRNQLESAVTYGPAREAVLAAMRPGGSGETWEEVANRMGITSLIFRGYLRATI